LNGGTVVVLGGSRWGDALALAGGALLALAFAPFNLWPLAILLPALLLWLWQGATPWRAARQGLLFGLGLFGVGISWVYISLHSYGNAPPPFAALVTLLLILLMALYPAVVGWLLARGWPSPGPVHWLLAAPALWALLEWVRSWLFTGFPWLALGYSQIDSPLAGLAPYLGVFGVSWAVFLSAGLLLLAIQGERRMRRYAGALALLLWGGAWGLGRMEWVEPAGEPLRISLIQGNISQERKWLPEEMEDNVRVYIRLSVPAMADSDVIIWPEAAIPTFYQNVEEFAQALQQDAKDHNVDYLIGVPWGDGETGIFHNSVVSLGRVNNFYHKQRLVPFGEYLPLRSLFSFFRDFVDIPMADFTSGERTQPLLQAGGHPVGVSICFEAVFGSEIRNSLPQAQFLVNVSNDAWFGDSLAPHQHLQIARMRALEAGRYLARATNTGITAIVDDRGKIIARGAPFQAEVVKGKVQPLSGTTPYVLWGDKVTVLLLAGLLVLALGLSRKKPVRDGRLNPTSQPGNLQ
jgi:apolipoprotein N-acyltransferase